MSIENLIQIIGVLIGVYGLYMIIKSLSNRHEATDKDMIILIYGICFACAGFVTVCLGGDLMLKDRYAVMADVCLIILCLIPVFAERLVR